MKTLAEMQDEARKQVREIERLSALKAQSAPPPSPINADVIRVLQEILDDAQKGVVTDVAVAYLKSDGGAGNNYSHGLNKSPALLGSLQYLQRDILEGA